MRIKQKLPQEFYEYIKSMSKQHGSMSEFARQCDIEPQKMSNWINGAVSIPESVLNAMGWEVVVTYKRKEK